MQMYKVRLPNAMSSFTGVRYGIRFVRGIGQTDDPILLQVFRDKGFEVKSVMLPDVSEPETPKMKRKRDE